MGKVAHSFMRTVVESQFTNVNVKPRIATGGAISSSLEVTRFTNWEIF